MAKGEILPVWNSQKSIIFNLRYLNRAMFKKFGGYFGMEIQMWSKSQKNSDFWKKLTFNVGDQTSVFSFVFGSNITIRKYINFVLNTFDQLIKLFIFNLGFSIVFRHPEVQGSFETFDAVITKRFSIFVNSFLLRTRRLLVTITLTRCRISPRVKVEFSYKTNFLDLI